ncbi:ABC transporter ATP-binding protein [Opitutaceae bacterium]|nr:ABC transporter ATP-binding protein [Opitutaceae bacterium]MDB4474188.1 ABC transporter ATP-binding protein [Opitutaceae bacterium]
MASDAIIVRNLVKKFARHTDKNRSYGLRDLMRDIVGRRRDYKLRADEFYALNNISFSVEKGECLGLVGRNGSGKTTLLRMIAGLQRPDHGSITVNGAFQALIALGAGFDRQLDGIENIKNAAALTGIGPRKIDQIIEEIVDFSELGEFIESPVGNYSSGMYARLGFAVAVFMRPEIILIDEILGVGDYAFQNKCFHKIHEIRNSGATILLVSHSHSRIIQMCSRALWFDHGDLVMDGDASEVVDRYIKSMDQEEMLKQQREQLRTSAKQNQVQRAQESPYGPLYADENFVKEVSFLVASEAADIRTHSALKFRYEFKLFQRVDNLNVSVNILTKDGILMTTISTLNGDLLRHRREGFVRGEIDITDLPLNPGTYVVVLPIHDGPAYLYRDVVAEFRVNSGERLVWGKVDFKYDYKIDPDS